VPPSRPGQTVAFQTLLSDHRGMAALPGAGTVYTALRATAAWGILEVSNGAVLVTAEGDRFVVPAPAHYAGAPLAGDGWTLKLEPGWDVQPGSRRGSYQQRGKERRKPVGLRADGVNNSEH